MMMVPYRFNTRFVHTAVGVQQFGVCGRVERTPPVFRCALYSLFAPAFRSRECHMIPPCTVVRLPLTEACLRNCRTSLFMPPFTRRDLVGSNVQAGGADSV